MSNNFRHNLKVLRKFYNLKQDDIRKITGKTYATVSRWESGENEPSEQTVEKLAKYFGVTPADLNYRRLDEQTKVDAPSDLFQLFAIVEKLDDKQLAKLLAYREGLLDAGL